MDDMALRAKMRWHGIVRGLSVAKRDASVWKGARIVLTWRGVEHEVEIDPTPAELMVAAHRLKWIVRHNRLVRVMAVFRRGAHRYDTRLANRVMERWFGCPRLT